MNLENMLNEGSQTPKPDLTYHMIPFTWNVKKSLIQTWKVG
jgi:hypothetical protein